MHILSEEDFLLSQKNDIIDKYVYITTSDLSGKITYISTAYLNFTGYRQEEVIGHNHSIFRNYDLDTSTIKQLWETIEADQVWEGELKNNKASGEEYWIKTIISPLYNADGLKVGYTAIKEDITDKKRLEELGNKDSLTLLYNRRYFDKYLKEELSRANVKKEKFALLLLSIDYYENYKDANGHLNADRAILEIATGLQHSLLKTTHMLFKITEFEFAIIALNTSDEQLKILTSKLLKDVEDLKIEHLHSKVSKYFTLSIGAVKINPDEKYFYVNDVFNLADLNLTKSKNSGKNIAVLDTNEVEFNDIKKIDTLTKLSNRDTLLNDVTALKDEAMLIILHIHQIGTLKNIYGFDFAKDVILQKTQYLKETLNDKEALLYNLNIKEFAILITDKTLFDKYLLILKHFILMDTDYYINSLDEYISADFTAGIAYGTSNLCNHADLVLQEALISKSNYKIYIPTLSSKQKSQENFKRLRIYKDVLHKGNIIPYFQPIVDTTSSKVVKYEALARIEMDDSEIISPYYFLDAAKEDKSFEYFTRQMMQKVFNIFSKNDIEMSMNLTYENITSPSMISYIKNRLEKFGGEGMTFEIVESEEILNYKTLKEFITMVKEYGCKVSVDDFGSGYSNFAHILQLDVDYIKLDGSIVQKLNKDDNIKFMVSGLIKYAKNANIKTIAEFVNSKELVQSVKDLEVDYIQGYYFGEPQSPQEYGLNI